MNKATVESTPPRKIYKVNPVMQAAREVLEEANGEWVEAAKIFRARLDNDQKLRAILLEPLLDKAIWAAIRGVDATYRKQLDHNLSLNNERTTEGLQAIASDNYESYYDYPLTGGVKLGDANRDEIKDAMLLHRLYKTSNAIKETWFALILKKMKKPLDIVRDVMSAEDLATMKKKARGEDDENA